MVRNEDEEILTAEYPVDRFFDDDTKKRQQQKKKESPSSSAAVAAATAAAAFVNVGISHDHDDRLLQAYDQGQDDDEEKGDDKLVTGGTDKDNDKDKT